MRLLQAATNTTATASNTTTSSNSTATATNTTVAAAATGTGDYEGWSAGFLTASKGFNATYPSGPVPITNQYNSWGRVSGAN